MALFFTSLIVIILFASFAHFFFRSRITFLESLAQCGIATVVSMIVIACIYYKDMGDHAIINGQITSKERVKVSCSHSYDCFCYESCSGSGDNRSCHQVCQTCYEHNYDVDWRVGSTVGNFEIRRINRQGTDEPPRWTAVQIGEPASSTVSYINYVKAAPDSLFAMKQLEGDGAKFGKLIPAYPQVYDYYRVSRVLNIGTNYPQTELLNTNLNMALRTMGASKQVNIVVVFVKTTDTQYRYALERAWLGGKKNDVIVVLGLDNDSKFSWVDTITFGKNSGNELLTVVMRDQIKTIVANQQFGDANMLSGSIITAVNENFTRKQMKDYEYLKDDYSPSQTALIWFVIIQIIVLTGTTIFFYHFELDRGVWAGNINRNSIHRNIPRYRR